MASMLAGFPTTPINPHLGIPPSGVPPGSALLLCDDVAAEGSFLLLHLLKGDGGECVRTVCFVTLAHSPSHYSHIARRMGLHFSDLCRQHRLAIIDGQQERQHKHQHQQQQNEQHQPGVHHFSPPVPFLPLAQPPSPVSHLPSHPSPATNPLRALYATICTAVRSLGCPPSSHPAPTATATATATAAPQPAASPPPPPLAAAAATSPSPSGAADVSLRARCGGQLCIVIDDVSLLETCAGGDSRLVMDFLSACRGLCTKYHRASLVLLTHAAVHPTTFTFPLPPPHAPPLPLTTASSPVASPPLLPCLLHLSDVVVLLRPLTSGHASDVHGQADITHLTPALLQGPPSHHLESNPMNPSDTLRYSHGQHRYTQPPCQQQHLVYQVQDSGAVFAAT
ncbi:hypothetical protein CLOM_g20878 [Closterium sp. NIES-68]|nr:hypothetical protein CLOM_g20878 [Closterium sp. NIES-68]GJP68498.1 hypothetical protein CLOP_g25198 [Closterium sp. NIES-67]